MLVKVINTTDGKFIGAIAPLPSVGDNFIYGDNGEYIWKIHQIIDNNDGYYTIASYNYIALVKVISPT